MPETLTLGTLRRIVRLALKDGQIEDVHLESSLIIEHASGLERAQQIMAEEECIKPEIEAEVYQILNRRLDGEPLDYIFGYKDFYGLRFEIDGHVLSPRPETEMLVDYVLENTTADQSFEFIDLGTGSGAIAIAILENRPNARAAAIDISARALKTARRNAQIHNVHNRIRFIQGNWGYGVTGQFDFLVSNPPYIDAAAMKNLPKAVSLYDPEIALAGGEDGLGAYRSILKQAKRLLKQGGHLVLEIGFDQGRSVSNLVKAQGFTSISVANDLSDHPRRVSAIATPEDHTIN